MDGNLQSLSWWTSGLLRHLRATLWKLINTPNSKYTTGLSPYLLTVDNARVHMVPCDRWRQYGEPTPRTHPRRSGSFCKCPWPCHPRNKSSGVLKCDSELRCSWCLSDPCLSTCVSRGLSTETHGTDSLVQWVAWLELVFLSSRLLVDQRQLFRFHIFLLTVCWLWLYCFYSKPWKNFLLIIIIVFV